MAQKEFFPIIYWMDPKWVTTFLSKSKVDGKTLKLLIAATKTYNKAIFDAGKEFEKNLKKCQNLTVRVKKPSPKK